MYLLVKVTINLPLCDIEAIPIFAAYLQQSLPALNSVSNLVEVVIDKCCMGCEGVAASGGDRVLVETEPQKHVIYHVNQPIEEYECEDDEDYEAVQEHGIDPYELPDITDPEYDKAGQKQESRSEHETSCMDENAFCLKC